MEHDLKVVTTDQLLELDRVSEMEGYEHRVPMHILMRIDVNGRHTMHAHSLYNMHPNPTFIRARSLVHALGSKEPAGPFLIDVPLFYWGLLEDMEFVS